MEQKLREKLKESFVETLFLCIMLILTSGTLLVIFLTSQLGKGSSLVLLDEWTLVLLIFYICFFVGSLVGAVIMSVFFAHDRKVLMKKTYEVYEAELAYFDICISGDETGTKDYVPVMTDLKTGKKIRLDHRDAVEKNRTYLIYRLPKTRITVAEKK